VCDSRPEAVELRQRVWGVPGFHSFQKLLASLEVDAVCLFLPHHAHRENVALAAQAGKPVLLEKPLAGTREDALAISDTIARAGIQLFLTHTGLFHPAFQHVLDFVRKGWLGVRFSDAVSAPDG
jgi:predicted dehydrogenase